MKKILLIFWGLIAWCSQSEGQKYLNIYQDGIVLKKVLASEVDSINITKNEPVTINFWQEGNIFFSYASEEVDSITVNDEKGDPLSCLGIVGFNSELNTRPIGVLSQSTVSQYDSFINNLQKKDGTILYYAVDSALNVVKELDMNIQLSSINFVTFTDGLDQGSLMMNSNYNSSIKYLQDISKRISDAKIYGLPIDAYTIGLRGKDVSDVELFKRNLTNLATSEDKAFEVKNISELRSRLQDIANKIISINTRQTISVKIPGIDDGSRIRFTFDGYNAENSQLYIEGTLNLTDYSLRDITYHGIKARSGNIVQGTQDGIFLTFTFTGMRREDEVGTLNVNNLKQFFRIPSSTTWQVNSEFTPAGYTQQNISYSGTLIFLVLDCSSSLGNDFNNMKSYAKEFINMVAKNTMPFKFESPKNVQAELDDEKLAVHVKWDPVKYADYYQIYRSKSNYYSTYELIADSISTMSWEDEKPLSGTSYYKVCAIGLGLKSELSNPSNGVTCSLDVPKNVTAALDNYEFAIHVSWDAVKYAKYYKIYRGNTSSNSKLIADSITSTTWIDRNPLVGYNYYKVYAVNQELTSSASYYAQINCKLEAPTNVKGELRIYDNNLCVLLNWDPSKYAESYKIYRGSRANSSSSYNLIADSISSTRWTDINPLKGSNYYKVVAIGHGMTSSQSYVSNETNYSLATPKNVKAELWTSGNGLAIKVSWDAVDFAQTYSVYRCKTSGGTYSKIAENITSANWIDSSPLSGNNYYKVYASGYGITSAASSASNVVNVTLAAPKNVKAELWTSGNGLAIKVSWDAVDFAQTYSVYRCNTSNGTYSKIAENITSVSWIDSSPLSGISYYRVRALGHELSSPDSNTSEEINYSLSVPMNVIGKLIQDGDNPIINITWDAVKFAESYTIYRCNNMNGNYSLLKENITTTSWNDESPLEGINYYIVCAVGYGLTSANSSPSNLIMTGTSAFTILNYIESNSSNKAVFTDIGVTLTDNTKFVIKVKPTNGGGTSLIGEYNAPSDKDDYRVFWYGNNIYYDYGNNGDTYGRRMYKYLSINNLYELEIGNYYVKNLNGSDILRGTALAGVATSHTRKISLFSKTEYGQLYYLKVYEGDTLIKDFIPVKIVDTDIVTLYDQVSKTFLTPNGTFKGN